MHAPQLSQTRPAGRGMLLCSMWAHAPGPQRADCGTALAQVASKLDAADKEKIDKEVDETIAWLDANQLAEVDELEHKLKELEGTCSPIISKMYQQVGPHSCLAGRSGARSTTPQGCSSLIRAAAAACACLMLWWCIIGSCSLGSVCCFVMHPANSCAALALLLSRAMQTCGDGSCCAQLLDA